MKCVVHILPFPHTEAEQEENQPNHTMKQDGHMQALLHSIPGVHKSMFNYENRTPEPQPLNVGRPLPQGHPYITDCALR